MRIRGMVVGLAAVALISSCTSNTPGAPQAVGVVQQGIGGNIHPLAIQVDGPAADSPGADLFPDAGTPLNAGAQADWVKDLSANSGTNCLGADGVASCIEANVTGATGGTGHWNGVRIVDGIGGNDQDIFIKGGKENDNATWDIAPGTVGSSKYDMVQAYLANNQTQLYFGMERAGNNGTTAFDFEFNQVAPMSSASCPQDPKIPCRTQGDVLFTFEMQGSGSSGSAVPFVFTWDGSAYVASSAAGIFSSINNSTTTKGGPWGHVDSHGNWALGNLDRFTFAEASAPLSLLPGVNACGGTAYVQVRTRSSSTVTSDLKDTSKIFQFTFLGVTGGASLTPSCLEGFSFAASGSGPNGPIADAGCAWSFSNGQTSTSCSGFLDAGPGTYGATVQVTDPANAGCGVAIDAGQIVVYPKLAVTPTLTATCNKSFGYDAGVTGGVNPSQASVAWTFDGGGTVTPSSSTTRAGSVAVGTGNVDYSGVIVATETRDGGLTCTASGSATVRPLAPLAIDLSLQTNVLQCPSLTNDAVTYSASKSGGNGVYTLTWFGPSCSGNTCTIQPDAGTFCATQSVYATLSDSSNLCPSATSETENYSKVTTLNASDNP